MKSVQYKVHYIYMYLLVKVIIFQISHLNVDYLCLRKIHTHLKTYCNLNGVH